MKGRQDELEDFKSGINLSEFAASRGYWLDRKATSRNSAVMRHENGDKIIIARGSDQHWTYFSINDNTDNGTVIDFLQNRGGGNLGEVRKTLRDWTPGSGLGGADDQIDQLPAFVLELEPISKDLTRVRANFHRCEISLTHPYLEGIRKIPNEVLIAPRFSGRILRDERNNTVFPHWNRDGICGFELKNENFTGFSPGGEKGLWCSRALEGDTTLVISETAIDALSYHALKGSAQMRYVSTGGMVSPLQEDLLRSAFQKLPSNGEVILALDHDEGGEKLQGKIETIFESHGEQSLKMRTDLPKTPGEDWNDALCAGS